jgi:uncharacterized membrane protein
MNLGVGWAVLAGILLGVFIAGAVLAASRKYRRAGNRFVALSALCAGLLALLFVFSPDAPDILDPMVDKFESVLKYVLGG